ncbi:hypothetical protein BDN70DRAFT_525839 [Pholiota conissans]|uniref:Uncharacterized protein n=1 Tax=Pholiota conissans TaxID=109636 RepID=A0A9P5YN36_9AGAR|nr:hypothetical protein BDN70DRAFT_525839 [Pholiota conissans]
MVEVEVEIDVEVEVEVEIERQKVNHRLRCPWMTSSIDAHTHGSRLIRCQVRVRVRVCTPCESKVKSNQVENQVKSKVKSRKSSQVQVVSTDLRERPRKTAAAYAYCSSKNHRLIQSADTHPSGDNTVS